MSKVRGTYWACLLSLACALAGSARIHAACAADSEQTSFNAGAVSVLGSEPSYIDVGAGVFDALSEGAGNRSAAGRIELRLGTKLLFIGPTIGLMANADGGALGGYHRGDSKDLGGVFQFRVGLGLSYQFEGGSRLGVRVDHISNAHIHDENPGEEEFLFTYAVPLGRLF
jgi:lipid A 3-O-deacylase